MKPHPSQSDQNQKSPTSSLSKLQPTSFRGQYAAWALLAAAALVAATFVLSSAEPGTPAPAAATSVPPPTDDWMRGAEDEKFGLVSKHLRGFDVTMVETGYRYTELYWTGQDRNWEFAAYQLDKIRHSIELGIERRPKRAASAQNFLTNAVPFMKQAIEKKDPKAFDAQFKLLTVACNTCHAMEKMAFVQIHPPDQRHSPVRFNAK